MGLVKKKQQSIRVNRRCSVMVIISPSSPSNFEVQRMKRFSSVVEWKEATVLASVSVSDDSV
ncbi:hypothetical protein SDJN02_10947, partial [Cucurbita argyrosperma subsp. argyrosperma]